MKTASLTDDWTVLDPAQKPKPTLKLRNFVSELKVAVSNLLVSQLGPHTQLTVDQCHNISTMTPHDMITQNVII